MFSFRIFQKYFKSTNINIKKNIIGVDHILRNMKEDCVLLILTTIVWKSEQVFCSFLRYEKVNQGWSYEFIILLSSLTLRHRLWLPSKSVHLSYIQIWPNTVRFAQYFHLINEYINYIYQVTRLSYLVLTVNYIDWNVLL